MSACGYNCPGCASCNSGGAWEYGAKQPEYDAGDIDDEAQRLIDLVTGGSRKQDFPEAGISLPNPLAPRQASQVPGTGNEPHGGGQPRRLDTNSDLPPSARTPISLGDVAVMGAGGVFLGKLFAKVFGR